MNRVIHLQDEELIAYLNGAKGAWRRRQMRHHLDSCLECRYHLNLLEEEMRDIVRSTHFWRQSDLAAIERAKETFRKKLWREEAQRRTSRGAWRVLMRHRRHWALAVALSIAGLLNLFIIRSAGDPLAKARATEDQATAHSAVRQEFKLLVSYANGAASQLRRIEVIFDPHGKRLSLAVRDLDGSLVYALWRPSSARALEYSSTGGGVRPLRPATEDQAQLTTAAPNGIPNIEKALIGWLESRDSSPILLSREGILVPSLTKLGRPGLVSDARNLLMLEWSTRTMQHPSVLTLSINASDYSPVSQTLQCEAAQVQVTLRVVHEALVSPNSIDPAVFEPSPMLVMAERKRTPGAWLAGIFRFPLGERV